MARTLRPLTDVTVADAFWSPRRETNRETTLPHVYEWLEDTGRVDNFRRAAGDLAGEFEGIFFNDSDVYKWLEGASHALPACGPDSPLPEQVEEVVSAVAAAQEESGYLNTYFQLEAPDERWTNLRQYHELYCGGHLIEAGVAHREATGERDLLDVATAFADHVAETFGPDGVRGYPGHEEIELALVGLYRHTGEERYLDLARYFVDERGTGDSRFRWELDNPGNVHGNEEGAPDWWSDAYAQNHAPVREQRTAEGHAVRATYLYSGMADVAAETGDESLLEALDALWENVRRRRTYLTGGVGSSHRGESFGGDYHLPNGSAYAETCAAIGQVFWNQRLLELTGESRFADALERALYNGFLAGVSLDGTEFFYVNPLASDGDHHREPWYDCACCPTNVVRLLASLERYVYQRDETGVYVSQFVSGSVETEFDGRAVAVEQETDYPWTGRTTLHVRPEGGAATFALRVRIPEWCDESSFGVAVDGEAVECDVDAGYATVEREWDGEAVEVTFPLRTRQVVAHPEVAADAGRVALRRGPLVYCLEAVDNDRLPHEYAVPEDAPLVADHEEDLLGGVTALTGEGLVPTREGWEDRLYRSRSDVDEEGAAFRAVPYYAWDHREDGEMRVWLHAA
ncbi:MAG: glycoside hydrolase family 127 protein [Halobacteriaceae archaeon]